MLDYYGTGRRKTSIARVHLRSGKGKIKINGRECDDLKEYFQRDTLVRTIREPFVLTETIGKFDILATVKGGGLAGQAGALRLGISRALIRYNDSFKPSLKAKKLLTRDPRMVERKKYGKKKARKSPQYSKR